MMKFNDGYVILKHKLYTFLFYKIKKPYYFLRKKYLYLILKYDVNLKKKIIYKYERSINDDVLKS